MLLHENKSSPNENTNFFDIVTGILQRDDTWSSYLL